MTLEGKRVTADRRRGTIKVIKDAQGVISFQWMDAGSNNPTDNIMVFPGDAKFEKVKQTQDRVYLLEFHANKQRWFYWFQDADKDKDAENCEKIHKIINGEDVGASSTTTPAGESRPQTRSQPTAQPPNPANDVNL